MKRSNPSVNILIGLLAGTILGITARTLGEGAPWFDPLW